MKYIPYIIILVLGIVIWFLWDKEPIVVNGEPKEIIKVVKDTSYVRIKIPGTTDTLKIDTTIYVPYPVLDSAKMDSVVNLYVAKNVYKDTFYVLNYGSLYVNDTVQMNKIIKRELSGDLKFPYYRDTIYVGDKKKPEFYVGLRTDILNGTSIGPSIMLRTKDKKIYSIYASYNQGKPVYGIGLNIKL